MKTLGNTLPDLQFLNVAENDLRIIEVGNITSLLSSLRTLNISRNSLYDLVIAGIEKLTVLRSLNISFI